MYLNAVRTVCAVLFLSLAAAGCQNLNFEDMKNSISLTPSQITDDCDISDNTENIPAEESFNLYYDMDNYTLKDLEPETGCYSGAYILSDKSVGYDIAQFELKAGPHGSYKYHLAMGDEFPLSWILSCYKEGKLPFVVISPSNMNKPFDYNMITQYAKKFGELKIPILVGLYPEPEKNGWEPEIYKSFFIYAREEFRTYAPNTAFVFITNPKEVYNADNYIDGKSVDWIGMELYMPITDGRPDNSCLNALNYLYMKYQNQYPIMISSLGVSSYTAENHAYFTTKAAGEIESIYNTVKEKYPRIKAIYYMDFDGAQINSINGKNRNSYLVTNGDSVTQSYKTAVSDSYFISEVNMEKLNSDNEPENKSDNSSNDAPDNNTDSYYTEENTAQDEPVTSSDAVSAFTQSYPAAKYKKNSTEKDNSPQFALLSDFAYRINNEYYISADCASKLGIYADKADIYNHNGEELINLTQLCAENGLTITKEGNKIYMEKE